MLFINEDLYLEHTCYLENHYVVNLQHCSSCFQYMEDAFTPQWDPKLFLKCHQKVSLCRSVFWFFEDSKALLIWMMSLLTPVVFETWAFNCWLISSWLKRNSSSVNVCFLVMKISPPSLQGSGEGFLSLSLFPSPPKSMLTRMLPV